MPFWTKRRKTSAAAADDAARPHEVADEKPARDIDHDADRDADGDAPVTDEEVEALAANEPVPVDDTAAGEAVAGESDATARDRTPGVGGTGRDAESVNPERPDADGRDAESPVADVADADGSGRRDRAVPGGAGPDAGGRGGAPEESVTVAASARGAQRSGNPTLKAQATTLAQKEKEAKEAERARAARAAAPQPSPSWWAPVMCTFLIVGLVYIITSYLFQGEYPLPIGNWNLVVGLGIALVGGVMAMRWR